MIQARAFVRQTTPFAIPRNSSKNNLNTSFHESQDTIQTTCTGCTPKELSEQILNIYSTANTPLTHHDVEQLCAAWGEVGVKAETRWEDMLKVLKLRPTHKLTRQQYVTYWAEKISEDVSADGTVLLPIMSHAVSKRARIIAVSPSTSAEHACGKLFDILDSRRREYLDRDAVIRGARAFGQSYDQAVQTFEDMVRKTQSQSRLISRASYINYWLQRSKAHLRGDQFSSEMYARLDSVMWCLAFTLQDLYGMLFDVFDTPQERMLTHTQFVKLCEVWVGTKEVVEKCWDEATGEWRQEDRITRRDFVDFWAKKMDHEWGQRGGYTGDFVTKMRNLIPQIILRSATLGPQHMCNKFFDAMDRRWRGYLNREQLLEICRAFGNTERKATQLVDEMVLYSCDKTESICRHQYVAFWMQRLDSDKFVGPDQFTPEYQAYLDSVLAKLCA
eukprot:comp8164_c0_seq1/m.3624 comp8164_c0_seq1/g.3624  ORF comp8164_c0_seq1/g.3624 comp8164_c0_seq1/m.3624 type:complete len:445 (-) comp8164_c0_seq1:625-1959(-)